MRAEPTRRSTAPQPTSLTVLGASGRCGRLLVGAAVERGHDVRAVVRPASPYRAPKGAVELRGEVLDPVFLEPALAGETTILSCLGLRRSGLTPWAELRSPPDLVQVVMAHLVRILPPRVRVIWMSAAGVHDSRELLTPAVRWLLALGNVEVAYHDLEAAERVVRKAGRPWLAVRPVTLVPGKVTHRAGPVDRYGLWSFVRRADVAEWMLDVADGTRVYEGDTVVLGS